MIGRLAAFHDPFEAPAERQQRPCAGDLSFWKDADDFALSNAAPASRSARSTMRMSSMGRDRNHPQRLHEGFEQRVAGILGIHDESYGPIDAGDQQEAVDERHMVRHQQRAAARGHMLVADDAETVETVRQDDENDAEQASGNSHRAQAVPPMVKSAVATKIPVVDTPLLASAPPPTTLAKCR